MLYVRRNTGAGFFNVCGYLPKVDDFFLEGGIFPPSKYREK